MEPFPFLKENFTETEIDALQVWQDQFCRLLGIYALCYDARGRMLTEFSGPAEDVRRLNEAIPNERMRAIYRRVSESPLEDQTVENTDIPNLRLAASAIKNDDGEPILTWIVCAVIVQVDSGSAKGTKPYLEGMSYGVSERKLLETLDLIRDTMFTLLYVTSARDKALSKYEQSQKKEQHLSGQFHRSEAMTEIVRQLDADESIEEICERVMRSIGEYLEISNGFLIHLHQGDALVDVTHEWVADGAEPVFTRTTDLERYWFLSGTKPQVISYNMPSSPAEKDQLKELGIRALAVMPVLVGDQLAFYACFAETRANHVWSTDDVKFLSDAVRILQSIITKRNQKNSLVGSYAALESMLDNIGCAVYVRDIRTGEILFTNRALTHHFARELRDNTLTDLFEYNVPAGSSGGNYEIYHEDKNRWYDLYYTHIKWVDFRPVSLCAIYDITEKKLYQKRIEQQAYTDFLTGLYNRMCCERDMAHFIEEANRMGSKGAVLYIDLDDFKHINDGLGHQYGDLLLKEISRSISSIEGIRESCYRMGGDEFVIIVPSAYYNELERIITDIQEIFNKPWYLKDADYYCMMSMGIVEFPTEGVTVQELIQKADIAMYAAKRGGKNRVSHYSDAEGDLSGRRLDMEKHMRNAALDNYSEFEVFFQPIVDIGETGSPAVGAEALIRWNSKMGFISPAEFIPLAEYLGLINPIGNYVLEEACRICREWNDRGYPDFHMNVNLSVVQLLQNDIVDIVQRAISDSGLNPHNLTLEVTESLAINDLDRTQRILMGIKKLGVRLALDDFGTGYSSLNNIRTLPFDIIKVDQNFVRDLTQDEYSRAFVKTIAELAKTIGARVCVEGIETAKQLKVIEDMHIRLIQGYYFSRPVRRQEFEDKYISAKKGK